MSRWDYFILLNKGWPIIGDPQEADCIIVLTFGRNSITAKELCRIADLSSAKTSDEETVKSILNDSFDAGEPNRSLAKDTVRLIKKFNIPAIVQWEVAVAMGERYFEIAEKVICLWPDVGKKSQNTMEVLCQLEKLGILPGKFKKPIVVAQKYHMPRTFLLIEKFLGYSPIVVQQHTDHFDPGSIQWWTKSKWLWYFKELLVRIHHLLCRWVW